MFENKFAVLGFGAVVAAGLVAAYIGPVPGKPTLDKPVAAVNETAQPQPVRLQPQVAETETAPAPDANHAGGPNRPRNVCTARRGRRGKARAPTFDVLRVEPSGSIVIAGKAAKNATVDLLSRGDVIGTTKSLDSGDFVIALDDPLKPGDYQLVLRSTCQTAPR